MTYQNAASFTQVIEDDKRDPRVSWQHHLDRKSSGGVDLVAKYGTPLPAATSCEVENLPWYGTGGNTVRLWHLADGKRNGFYDEYMHLSEFTKETGDRVSAGTIVGLSGASGPNKNLHYYAPHWHWHLYTPQGTRVIPWDYFDYVPPTSSPVSSVASVSSTPITPVTVATPKQEEEDMFKFVNAADGKPSERGVYAVGRGGKKHLSGQEKGLLERWRNENERDSLLLAEMDIISNVLRAVS